MSRIIQIHPEDPQQRLIKQAVSVLRDGGVIVYPTDSCYALGCHIGDKAAAERIRRIRKLDHNHHFTLMCKELSDVGLYAKLTNPAFRLIKALTPGPYTFILEATKEVPKRLLTPKRKTIGLRIPNNPIVSGLLHELHEPIISTTLQLPNEEIPMSDPYEMKDLLDDHVNLVIDGGYCGIEPTTVVELLEEEPKVLRKGIGPIDVFNN